MNIILSNQSSVPLYEQIAKGITEAILNKELKKDEALPSIRYLAKELQVSIITTKRAYEELEKQGFIKTIPGKGSYVSTANNERFREIIMSQNEEKLKKIIDNFKNVAVEKEEFINIIHLLWED